jgi:anti-sigma B factor antagonist
MNCVRTDTETETRLAIEGSLDALTAAEIRPVFDKVVADRRRRVIVDASKLTLLDSSGVGAIVSLYKRLKADGGQLNVAGARDQPLAVLKLLKLDRVFGL